MTRAPPRVLVAILACQPSLRCYTAFSDDRSSIAHTDNREEVDEVMNPVRLLTAGLLTVTLPLAAHPQDSKLRVAAAITYEETGRPQGLPEAFQPGSSATFLTIASIDGHQNNAVLWRSSKGGDSLLVSTGGSGGAYHADPLSNLGRGLSDAGASVLSINTRQTGDRVNTDNFFDIGKDLDAAVKAARSLGYKTIVLHGHSLGNLHVQFYAATHWDSDIKGVVLTSAFADLPWKSRNMLVQDEARYLELRKIALDYQRSGKSGGATAERNVGAPAAGLGKFDRYEPALSHISFNRSQHGIGRLLDQADSLPDPTGARRGGSHQY
jgi:pimeloyl-ACP methyl ester carboxylesterase